MPKGINLNFIRHSGWDAQEGPACTGSRIQARDASGDTGQRWFWMTMEDDRRCGPCALVSEVRKHGHTALNSDGTTSRVSFMAALVNSDRAVDISPVMLPTVGCQGIRIQACPYVCPRQ
jgi:hypothetical protein